MNLCLIGKIIAAHGNTGEVRIRTFSDIPGRFQLLEKVLLGNDELSVQEVRILKIREKGNIAYMRIEGYATRNDAEKIIGCMLYIRDEDMMQPPAGKYFVHDIIGCEVFSTNGEPRGQVVDVLLLPANDVYVINFAGKEVLIPAVPDFVTNVDVNFKKIIVESVSGLFEEENED